VEEDQVKDEPVETSTLSEEEEEEEGGEVDGDEDQSEETQPHKRKAKKSKLAPPTFEEIKELKDTEQLFKSNLFRLEVRK
jgi:hypothetical protein